MQKITIVTATVFNAQRETTTASTFHDERETVDEAIAEAKREAIEDFEDNYSDAAGVIVHVDHVEVPELPTAIITGERMIEPVALNAE